MGLLFSSGHVWMWELDYKESWALKNWCFWTVVLEKTLESSLDCKDIQPVHPKGNQSWLFIGRTDVEAETPILCPPDAKNWLTWKDPNAGKDWRLEEKGTTEDEMVKDRGAWRAAVHGVTKSRTWLSDSTTTNSKCWRGCADKGTILHGCLEWMLVTATMEDTGKVPSTMKMKLENFLTPCTK